MPLGNLRVIMKKSSIFRRIKLYIRYRLGDWQDKIKSFLFIEKLELKYFLHIFYIFSYFKYDLLYIITGMDKYLTNERRMCMRNNNKKRRSVLIWIQSSEWITAGIFAVMIFSIVTLIRFSTVDAGATSGVTLDNDGINEIRMTSVDYVFTYDSNINTELKEAIRNYIYASVDSAKLLHMVNMRQHVVFTNGTEISISDDGTTVYMPISSSSDQLWEILSLLD